MRAAAPAGAGGASTFDPIKVFKKYLILLIIASFVGVAVGVGGFIVLRRYAPQYKAEAYFNVLAPRDDIADVGTFGNNKEELERFMATQAASMVSVNVLEGVVTHPRLVSEAPDWSSQFLDSSGRIIAAEAIIELQETLVARPVPNTTLIQLSFEYGKPQDVFTVVQIVTEEYLEDLRTSTTSERQETRDQLAGLIEDLEQSVEREQRAIDRLLSVNKMESVDARLTEASQTLNLAVESLNSINELITLTETQQQEYLRILNDARGIAFPEDIRAQVSVDPLIQQLKSQLQARQASLRSLERLGLGAEHPQMKLVQADIQGLNDEIGAKTEELLTTQFNQAIDTVRRQLNQLYARQAELQGDVETAQRRLNEVTTISQEIASLQRSVEQKQTRIADNQARLDEVRGLGDLSSASRVTLRQAPRLPDQVSFPKIEFIVPAGFVLVVGLTSLVIVLREVLDQRIKGPSDIAMIPRTPLLGMLPDVGEDPSRPKRAETAFQDRPSGVFAESVRQLRVALLKKIHLAGHRSVLVVPASPRSGATSLVTNLAQAAARADSRVLIVDANLRRPAVHGLFDLAPSPGLADVLADAASIDEAICRTDNPSLDVMTVGAPEHRVFERIATEPMSRLLSQLEARYDLVILDVAPAIVSGDAFGLANRVGGTILVVRALSEKRGLVARLRTELNDARGEFLGVVVNAVRASAGGYFKRNMRTAHAYQNRKAAAKS